ncbi:TonB-dependent receptor [Flavobacteriaceae bacterium F08102]|nr:TonB-dependent receptor [Flavobacteriaceae bacterium F08102]
MIKHVLLLCLLSISFLNAQEVSKIQTLKSVQLKGTVYAEEDKQPIFGATVLVKGTKNGVSTDLNGNFSISVNLKDVLVITSIGFETFEKQITDDRKLEIYLKNSIETLGEVTIIGYGTQEKRDLTGSISSIKGADIDKTVLSFDNALTGKLSGVQVLSSSGVPGSATAITIRGISSLNANSNNPLIVIDGIPVYGSDRNNNTTGFGRTSVPAVGFGGTYVSTRLDNKEEFERNPLAMLNPNDIESIEILKDAYATAIYGSRGAAGVILITTKSGKSGKARINLNYATTISQIIAKPEVLSASEYSDFYNTYTNSNKYPLEAETNWLDETLRSGITNSVNFSMSAGNDKMNYFFSSSYLNQESYIVEQDYEKFNTRINLDYKFSDKFKFGTNFSINFSDNNALNAQSIYRNSVLKAPNIKAKTDLNTYYFGYSPNAGGLIDNPLAQAYEDINYIKDARTIANIFLEYKPFSWLTLKSEGGIDNFTSEAYSRIISRPDIQGGNATQVTTQNRKFVVNNTATMVKTFDNLHAVNAVIGQSFETSREMNTAIWGREFSSDEVLSISRAGERGVQNNLIGEWALFSAFGRLNYQFNHKYLAGVTYRIDGSSRFNKNNRYIGFPSFSVGWRISEESFLKDIKAIDEIKFRASTGYTGIDGSSGYYGNQGQYTLQGNGLQYAGTQILQAKQPNNPNLKWERTRTLDLGLDVSLWNERLDLKVDYYHKKITNLLYSSAVPWFLGYDSQQQNIGDMENKGIEVELSGDIIRTQNITWNANFNISRNTNKILKLNFDGSHAGGASLGYKYFAEGESAGQFYMYDWAGVNPLTGNPLWNYPDGTQSEVPPASLFANSIEYRRPMGDAAPDFYGGLTNSIRYKNFKLDFFFSFSSGGQLYNGTKALLMTYATSESHNLSRDILDYWKIIGHKTDVPRLDNASIITRGGFGGTTDYISGRDSNRFLEDGSYIRLKNINLSYDLPQKWLQKNFINSLSIYVQANNVLTFTKYSGLDPEVSAFGSSALLSGYDELTMPQSKSYSVGLNIGF